MPANTTLRVRCPGCGKEHFLTEAPATPLKKRCLRCTEMFSVIPEMTRAVEDSLGEGLPAPYNMEGMPEPETLLSEERIHAGAGEESVAAEQETEQTARTKKSKRRQRDEEESPSEEHRDDAWPPEEGAEDNPPEARRPLWPLVSLLMGGGILAAGAAWYFLVGQPPGSEATKRTASSAPTVSASHTTPSTPSPKTEPAKVEPPKTADKVADKATNSAPPSSGTAGPKTARVSAEKVPPLRISAARLSAEMAANPEAIKKKYAGRILQVSGLFDKLQSAKPQHAFFICEGGPAVSCDLTELSVQAMRSWSSARSGKPLTVQGQFGTDLKLHGCEVLPLAAPADDKYLGKEVEVIGYVTQIFPPKDDREYPMIKLERETNSLVDMECLFRRADEPELKKLQLGTLVTLSAVCSGRKQGRQGQEYIRFDNCRLIYTTAPVPPTVRLEVTQLLRDYEEDLRPALPPSQPSTITVSAAELDGEFAADSKAAQKKYKNKIITVVGNLYRKAPPILLLEAGSTNQLLRIQCYFSAQSFRELEERNQYTIRGLCSGLASAQMLRLDNCQSMDVIAASQKRTLTADYFPFKAGQSLTYDQAAVPADGQGGSPLLVRRVFSFQEGGLISTAITHTGKLTGATRLSESLRWKGWTSTKGVQKAYIEGPVYGYRQSGGFIEIGQQTNTSEGPAVNDWQPLLKIFAKAGDSWKWSHAGAHHHLTLVKFAEHQGKPSAIVQETVTSFGQSDRPVEIRHVYVENVGEVEQMESTRMSNGQVRILSIMRLVDDEDVSLPEKPAGKPKASKRP